MIRNGLYLLAAVFQSMEWTLKLATQLLRYTIQSLSG